MKKLNFVFLISCCWLSGTAQFGNLKNPLGNVQQDIQNLKGNKSGGLSDQDVSNGLKDALRVGSNNAAGSASKTDGFFGNSLIKIPFPPDAEKVRQAAVNLGMQKQVDDFVLSLNRSAEKASQKAAPIFLDAIMGITIDDGMKILHGPNDAATQYLKTKTSQKLHDAFHPIVQHAVDSVQVTKYWNPIANVYNSDPFVKPVNPDLPEYITQKALDGLFILLAAEELKIRQNPTARVTDILKKVFGTLDK